MFDKQQRADLHGARRHLRVAFDLIEGVLETRADDASLSAALGATQDAINKLDDAAAFIMSSTKENL